MDTTKNNSQWQPPLELQRSTPREVRLSAAGRALAGLAIALLVAAVGGSLWMLQTAGRDAARWASWQAEATSTQGEIAGLRRSGSGDNTKYWVDFQYRAGERMLSGSSPVRRERWRRLRQAESIQVFYVRSRPEQSWLAGAEPKGMPIIAAVLVPLLVLLPATLIAWQIRRQTRLLEEGRVARARVVSLRKISSQHGRHHRVVYEFQALGGGKRTGRYDAARNAPGMGDELTVLYSPDDEGWSAPYPLKLVRVRED